MDITRWSPLFGLTRMLEPSRWLEEWASWRGPSVDIFQAGNDLVITAEVPGIDPADLDVRVSEDSLTIKGSTGKEERQQREGVYYSERRYGNFYRSIPLPVEVQPEKARATYRNGVLEVRVPAAESGNGRAVKVDVQTQ
ncbi:MAG: Hsp20/alpha crystallin family protein [Bacillota bacterium]